MSYDALLGDIVVPAVCDVKILCSVILQNVISPLNLLVDSLMERWRSKWHTRDFQSLSNRNLKWERLIMSRKS